MPTGPLRAAIVGAGYFARFHYDSWHRIPGVDIVAACNRSTTKLKPFSLRFSDYPRLFIFETGVHFLDTFRYLFGEPDTIYARTAKRNPVIRGDYLKSIRLVELAYESAASNRVARIPSE